MVTLTRNEAIDLQDLIEDYLFKIIRADDSIDSIHWLANMISVWKKCDDALLHDPHIASNITTQNSKKDIDALLEKTAKLVNEHWKDEETTPDDVKESVKQIFEQKQEPAAPSAPVFLGPQAALKRSVYDRLQAYRVKGMSSVEISKMTNGKVTPDEVLEILAGAKMPFNKWKALDNVLEGKQEEAAS